MALIAELIDIGNIQQPRILRSMRSVASHASFALDCGVFEYEGSARLGVTLGADRIHVGGGLNVIASECTVNIMAVAALQQSFIHLVMEGHGEGRLDVSVAAIAELGLRGLQQMLLNSGIMNAMAAAATHATLGVGRTAQTGRIDLLGRGLAELNDLGDVSAALNVLPPWPMTTLAGCARTVVHQREPRVWVAAKLFHFVGVTVGADLRADKIGGVCSSGLGSRSSLLISTCRIQEPGSGRESRQQRNQSHIQ